MQISVRRNKVAVIFQDRLYLLQPGQPLCISQPAAVVDALRRIFARQTQQPQTQAIGLLLGDNYPVRIATIILAWFSPITEYVKQGFLFGQIQFPLKPPSGIFFPDQFHTFLLTAKHFK
ncbi:TPA: hypothetical protein QIB60_004383 [Enterobacter cloacae subsp. dissolvens]|nr:hypothetical protein [Enterobacter cloacae subsp. dissolvens]